MLAGSHQAADQGAPSSISVTWKPWAVVPRARGFHVSRETESGDSREFLRNEVRAVKVFRKRELADAACAAANDDGTRELLDFERRLVGAQSALNTLREKAIQDQLMHGNARGRTRALAKGAQ